MNTKTLIESELAVALGELATQFRVRATSEGDFRSASYFLALETLRVTWEAGLYAGEPISTGDRR